MYASSTEQRRSERVTVLAEQLYRDHHRHLLHVAERNAANHADAEEAVQFAFLAFLQKFHPDSGAPPLAWVLLTLKRRCWQLRRRQPLDRRVGQEAAPGSGEPGFSIEAVVSEAPDSDEALERSEWLLDARQRLAQLKPAERRALVLIAAGYSYKEIGAALNWTYSKTNRCAAEGRAALRAAISA